MTEDLRELEAEQLTVLPERLEMTSYTYNFSNTSTNVNENNNSNTTTVGVANVNRTDLRNIGNLTIRLNLGG